MLTKHWEFAPSGEGIFTVNDASSGGKQMPDSPVAHARPIAAVIWVLISLNSLPRDDKKEKPCLVAETSAGTFPDPSAALDRSHLSHAFPRHNPWVIPSTRSFLMAFARTWRSSSYPPLFIHLSGCRSLTASNVPSQTYNPINPYQSQETRRFCKACISSCQPNVTMPYERFGKVGRQIITSGRSSTTRKKA